MDAPKVVGIRMKGAPRKFTFRGIELVKTVTFGIIISLLHGKCGANDLRGASTAKILPVLRNLTASSGNNLKYEVLPAARLAGTQKKLGVHYLCPASALKDFVNIASCTDERNDRGVGSANSGACQVGYYVYCYSQSLLWKKNPEWGIDIDFEDEVLPPPGYGGTRRKPGVRYWCPSSTISGMVNVAGCNDANSGVGNANDGWCPYGEDGFIYCYESVPSKNQKELDGLAAKGHGFFNEVLPAPGRGGSRRKPGVRYLCPASTRPGYVNVAGCNSAKRGVGNPNSKWCQFGYFIYCYPQAASVKSPKSWISEIAFGAGFEHGNHLEYEVLPAPGKGGSRRKPGVHYFCPASMPGYVNVAGCNNAKRGVGNPNTSACQFGYFIYCYPQAASVKSPESWISEIAFGAGFEHGNHLEYEVLPAPGKGGSRRKPGVHYLCPASMPGYVNVAGCNNAKRGVGNANSKWCQFDYFIYCVSYAASVKSPESWISEIAFGAGFEHGNHLEYEVLPAPGQEVSATGNGSIERKAGVHYFCLESPIWRSSDFDIIAGCEYKKRPMGDPNKPTCPLGGLLHCYKKYKRTQWWEGEGSCSEPKETGELRGWSIKKMIGPTKKNGKGDLEEIKTNFNEKFKFCEDGTIRSTNFGFCLTRESRDKSTTKLKVYMTPCSVYPTVSGLMQWDIKRLTDDESDNGISQVLFNIKARGYDMLLYWAKGGTSVDLRSPEPDYHDFSYYKFYLRDRGDIVEHGYLVNEESDECLDVEGTDGKGKIQTHRCENEYDQYFFYYENEELVNKVSNECINIKGEDGYGDIFMGMCEVKQDQQWVMVQKKEDYFSLASKKSNECIDVEEYSGKGSIQTHECEGLADQKWKWDKLGSDVCGEWELKTCNESAPPAMDLWISVSYTNSETETISATVRNVITAGIQFEFSSSLARSFTHEESERRNHKAECKWNEDGSEFKRGCLWQWKMSGSVDGRRKKREFVWESPRFKCTPDDTAPICPPFSDDCAEDEFKEKICVA